MKAEGNIWIEKNPGIKIGKGRAMLMEKIKETGSIAQAARKLNLSYRKAWAMVKEMNSDRSKPVIEKCAGGINGGSAHLTIEGEKLLNAFRKLADDFEKFRNKYSDE